MEKLGYFWTVGSEYIRVNRDLGFEISIIKKVRTRSCTCIIEMSNVGHTRFPHIKNN